MRALLLLGAGLFVQIPTISAQEELSHLESVYAEDPFRTVEQTLFLGEGSLDTSPAAANSTWMIVRMVLTLALAAAAIYGIVFLIKRSGKKTINNDPFLKILASAHLGSNRHTHIVAVGSQAWLLGSTDGGVNVIGEIADKDILNAMLLEDSRKSAESASGKLIDFMSILRRMGVSAEPRTPGAEDIRKRRERLKEL